MIMLVLGGHAYSQDDNLTSDTSNRRVQHGPNAKEQLSLTDTERDCANWKTRLVFLLTWNM